MMAKDNSDRFREHHLASRYRDCYNHGRTFARGQVLPMTSANQIDAPYALEADAIQRFRDDGFLRLQNVMSSDVLAGIEPEITRMVDEGNRLKDIPLSERT